MICLFFGRVVPVWSLKQDTQIKWTNCNVRDVRLIAGFVTTFEFTSEAALREKDTKIYPSRDFLI